MNGDDLVSLAGVLLAGLSALLSYFAARQARIAAAKSSEASRRVAEYQTVLQRYDLRLQYDNEVRAWATKCVKCLGELHSLCKRSSDETTLRDRERVMEHLSSLVECGRLFFPNDQTTGHGDEKAPARRGIRDPRLNLLMQCYRDVESISEGVSTAEIASKIFRARRNFVYLVQASVASEVEKRGQAQFHLSLWHASEKAHPYRRHAAAHRPTRSQSLGVLF